MNLLEKKKFQIFFFSRSNEVTVCVEASRIIIVIIVSNTYQLLARVFNFIDPFLLDIDVHVVHTLYLLVSKLHFCFKPIVS